MGTLQHRSVALNRGSALDLSTFWLTSVLVMLGDMVERGHILEEQTR